MSPEASIHSQSIAWLYHFCYSIILPSLPISNILFILLFIMIAIDSFIYGCKCKQYF